MRAPAAIAEAFVEPDRGALRVAQIEVQHDQPQFARQHLDLGDDCVTDAAAARPRRDKSGGDGAGESLRLVVARRARKLHRAGDDAVEPADDELSLRDQQYALPVILQHLTRRHLDPAETAAFEDRALGRLAQIVEIGAGILRQALDGDAPGRPETADVLWSSLMDAVYGRPSWTPSKKVRDQPQSRHLALFRMKLRADQIVPPDRPRQAVRRNR